MLLARRLSRYEAGAVVFWMLCPEVVGRRVLMSGDLWSVYELRGILAMHNECAGWARSILPGLHPETVMRAPITVILPQPQLMYLH
jgi:hypothetical protein